MTMGQYWLGKTKPQKVFRSTQNALKKLLRYFYFLLTDWLTDWLTNYLVWCLQTRQWQAWLFHCSNVASAWEMPFASLLYMHGFFMDLPVPSFVSHPSWKVSILWWERDGFHYSQWKLSVIFIVATLIAE